MLPPPPPISNYWGGGGLPPPLPTPMFLPMRQSLFYICSAGKFCFAHGLRQLTRGVKSDVRTINFISDVTTKTPNDARGRSLCDLYCQKKKE